MRNRRFWISAAALLTVACLTLSFAGCSVKPHQAMGIGVQGSFFERPPADIVHQAVSATDDAKTLRVQITVQSGRRVVNLDLRRTAKGECYGTASELTQKLSVIATEDYTYLRASATYWHLLNAPGVSPRMEASPSLWGRFPANPEIRGFCSIEKRLTELDLGDEALADLRAGRPYPFAGDTVVALSTEDNSTEIIVGADAPHYIRVIRDGPGRATLSEFGRPASVTIPTKGQYVPFRDAAASI